MNSIDADIDPNLIQRLIHWERVRQANFLLTQTCFNNYPATGIDTQVKNEMDQIRLRLDKLAFAIRWPEQAEQNKTLDS